jgi:hypothetical protein
MYNVFHIEAAGGGLPPSLTGRFEWQEKLQMITSVWV